MQWQWTEVVFGWPFAFTSIIVSVVGLLTGWSKLVWLGASIGLPFMFYLFATPRFGLLAAVAAPCHFCAAIAMRRSSLVAWLLFLPTLLTTGYVVSVVAG